MWFQIRFRCFSIFGGSCEDRKKISPICLFTHYYLKSATKTVHSSLWLYKSCKYHKLRLILRWKECLTKHENMLITQCIDKALSAHQTIVITDMFWVWVDNINYEGSPLFDYVHNSGNTSYSTGLGVQRPSLVGVFSTLFSPWKSGRLDDKIRFVKTSTSPCWQVFLKLLKWPGYYILVLLLYKMQKVGCVRWFHDRYYSRLYSDFAKKGAELFYLYPGRNFLFKGAFLWEKSESKTDFCFFGKIQKGIMNPMNP